MHVRELDENVIAEIGHAFGCYDYGAETGLVSLYPSREDAAEYICAYVRAALKGGFLHTVGEHGEAYIAYKRSGDKISIRAVWPVVRAELRGRSFAEKIDLLRQINRLIRLTQKGGPGLEDRFKKEKKPYLFVGMVCVRERYQGQGFMRPLMELAFAEGSRLGVPVILETDAMSKCEKYVHLGMELAGTRDLGKYGKIYDLIKYPDADRGTETLPENVVTEGIGTMNQKINLTGVPETMLQTIYARAKESRGRGAVCDKKAEEIVSRLDYDFSLADKDTAMHSGVIARTIVLDRLTTAWLAAHPGAAVVNIACGLDTRCYRMTGYAHWYNLDLPETMAVRAKLLPESGKISQIAMSAMDNWGREIKEQAAPVLVIIEGLTMYLSEADVQRIFTVISGRFQEATVFVETMNPMVVKRFKEKSIDASNAKFTWGVKNGAALAELVPDFRFAEEHSLTEGMAAFAPVYKLLDRIPAVRNISNKIIVLEKKA